MERSFADIAVTLGTGAGTASSELLIPDRAFGSIQFDATPMTGTKLLIEGTNKSGVFVPLMHNGVQLEIPFVASAGDRIPDAAFGRSKLRFKSDANETAIRSFDFHLVS